MSITIIITGAGTGIGRSIAIKCAKEGYDVIAIGRRLEKLLETQSFDPKKITIIQADVSQEKDREKIIENIKNIKTTLFLIHNAALAEPLKLLKNITLEEWQKTQAINVEAPLFLTKILLPYLHHGRILHISSGLAHHALLGCGTYCVSKAALFMLYKCLKEELKEYNIAVASMEPGIVDTPMQGTLRSQDEKQFPTVERFKELQEQDMLVSSERVADFIFNVLFKTDDKKYSEKEWVFS